MVVFGRLALWYCLLVAYRYLALVAALAAEADFMFCPESPPGEDWERHLCGKLEQVRQFRVQSVDFKCDMSNYLSLMNN